MTIRPVSVLPLASLRSAVNCCVPATAMLALAGLSVTDATGAVDVAVVPLATFDRLPSTAFTPRVPRNATTWNW